MSFSLMKMYIFFLFLGIAPVLIQNLDHACIRTITVVLEDVNQQVTLNRGGEVQFASSNQGFYLNGKTLETNFPLKFMLFLNIFRRFC